MNIEQLIGFWESANESERQKFAEMMSNMNVQNRNLDKTEKYAEKIIKTENEKKIGYVKFLESKSVNGLIWAPTQVGKSAATRIFIETCFKYNTPVIVSTDNKTDQQEQLYNRIEHDLMGASVELLKVSDKTFEHDLKKCIENKNKRFVIFCLDNSSQIEKVIIQLTSNYARFPQMTDIKRIAIIHDEADTVAKDYDTMNIRNGQAESHKKWLELNDIMNKRMGDLDMKRVFVTATPENVVLLYKIECPDVMRLEIPSTYTGYNNITNTDLTDDLCINQKLSYEVDRIKEAGTYEAILYCIDRKIQDGQNVLLKNLAKQLNCTVNTYNGDGICAYIKKEWKLKFEKKLQKYDIMFKKSGKFYQMKNLAIRKFYKIMKSLGENCVVTIGKDLICRGISYVGEDIDEPITATVMFYKPGKTMNAVGICQTIGRITGCAMPSLKRKLYCPKEVYDTYISYNKNQEKFIKEIENNDNETTKVVVDSNEFEKYTRPIDRPKLNLKMKFKTNIENETSDISDDSESSDDSSDNLNKMKKLIDRWHGKKTIIGKILGFVYENEDGINEKELKEFITEIGSNDSNKMYHHLTTKTKEYNIIFNRKKNITNLNKEAREYIDNME